MKVYSSFLPIERYNKFILSKEKYKNIPITIFNDYFTKNNWDELTENPINIIILNEPNQLFGHHTQIQKFSQNYNLILTWGQDVIDNCSNAQLFIHGETNLDKEYINSFKINPNRKFEVTFLSGVLELIEGHKLRQKILSKEKELNIPLKFWKVLDDFNHKTGNRPGYRDPGCDVVTEKGTPIEGEGKKQVWNRNSMFHIAVENSRNLNYYTDKIVDCFATKTIPIYWGAPNIEDYFNKEGIITFENEDDLVEILNNLTEEDYKNRLEAIEENHILALENGFFFDRLENTLDKIIELNNLNNEK
tara:strand:- start:656 stop:1567 length:912 start_codon:yes stop_codon:yes gene_type:complete